MILVTIGTSNPFDRLLRAVDGLAADEEVVVQRGRSAVQPVAARCVDYLPFEELAALVEEARAVVMHAGAGSILLALMNGHRPIVVPRLRRYGEVVDDHQLVLAERLDKAGIVRLVVDPANIRDALREGTRWPSNERHASTLAGELVSYVSSVLGDTAHA